MFCAQGLEQNGGGTNKQHGLLCLLRARDEGSSGEVSALRVCELQVMHAPIYPRRFDQSLVHELQETVDS